MKIIDVSKCNEEVISYINELQNKYAELEKLNKELDRSNITIFEENNYLIKENKRLNNIISELEKWLETQRYFEYEDPFTGEYAKDEITPIVQTLDKLQELKGDDKE